MTSSCTLFLNHNARPGLPNWLKVRPLTAAGAQSAFGAVVRVTCVAGCATLPAGWQGVRSIGAAGGYLTSSGYDAHFGLPDVDATYNVTVTWPGNVHPQASYTTHPRLGSITPSLATWAPPASRLIVVRPSAVSATLAVSRLQAWDVSSTSFRDGLVPAPPSAGDAVTIPLDTSPSFALHDLAVVRATVNNADVSTTVAATAQGLDFTYTTQLGDEQWPWTGLTLDVLLRDSAGLETVLQASVTVGATFEDVSDRVDYTHVSPFGLCTADVNGA